MTQDLIKSFKDLENKLLGKLDSLAKDNTQNYNVSILKEIEATASALLSVANVNEFYKKR